MSEVRDIWEQGAHLLDQAYAGNIPYHRSHQVIVDLLPRQMPVRVLDLGAGTGLLDALILERLPDSRVTCVDFSPRMVAESRRRLHGFGDRVELVCADIATWTATESYDAVVTCNALVYKETDIADSYRRHAAALRPGGLFLNSTTVRQDTPPFLGDIMGDLSPDASPPSEELLVFARGPGRRIAHFGEGSLAVALAAEEHVALMHAAGLYAFCAWHYLQQAVILGQKPANG